MADYERQARYREALANPNVQRALASIRDAEGTAQYANPYGTLFGGAQASDLSTHPGLSHRTGSSAAGAYQMLGRTWNGIANSLGLTDFGPESQDIAAVGLIDGRGALGDVMAGNVPGFATKVHNEWASFPGGVQQRRSVAGIQRSWDRYGTAQAAQHSGLLGTPYNPATVDNPASVGPVERGILSPPDDPQFGPMTQQQSLADQYGLYGLGQLATQRVLNPASVAPTPGYVDPQVTTKYRDVPAATPAAVQAPPATASIPQQAAAPAVHHGLLSGLLGTGQTHINPRAAVGSVLGAVAGGLLAGPVGGILGGLLGNTIGTHMSYPSAPQAPANSNAGVGARNGAAPSGGMGGYGSLSAEGRSAYANSPQARSAVDNKSPGLW